MPDHPQVQTRPDVEKCVSFLTDLEMTWSGAGKSRAIIEQLLRDPRRGTASSSEMVNKRSFAEFDDTEVFSWDQLPGSELFTYEASGADLLNEWVP
jgi:hypothetical protein